MNANNVTALSTGVIAFSTSLGVLMALLQYVLPTKDANFIIISFWSEIYILVILSFLYLLKRLQRW